MTDKQRREWECAKRVLEVLGYQNFHREEREKNDKPDNVVRLEVRRIGIEVTDFPADAGRGTKSGRLRAEEKKKARDSKGRPYTMAVPLDPVPGIRDRIRKKIRLAAGYDDRQYDELWLLISSQLTEWGATASTFAVQQFVNLEDLNRFSHDDLKNSRFRAAYIHLMLENVVYMWSPSGGWEKARTTQSNSPTARGVTFKSR